MGSVPTQPQLTRPLPFYHPLWSERCDIGVRHVFCNGTREPGLPCYCPCHFPEGRGMNWKCCHVKTPREVANYRHVPVVSDASRRSQTNLVSKKRWSKHGNA